MSHCVAQICVIPRLLMASLPAGLVLGPSLLSVSPNRARGRWGLCPGKQLQLSLQRLSLPQAPLPEAWLEAHWHGCSALAACKWICSSSQACAHPKSSPSGTRHWGLAPPSTPCSHCPYHGAGGWKGLGLISGWGHGLAGAHAQLFLAPPRHAAGCAGNLPPDAP